MNRVRFDFDDAVAAAERKLGTVADRVSESLGARDICIVGGASRDVLMGDLVGRPADTKDVDVILASPPKNIEKNPDVVWRRHNSFGGIKLGLCGIGEVDVFHQYTNDVPALVANYFDYNCNSLYYSQKTRRLETSVYFLHFLETATLHICLGYKGSRESLAVRAIKFQVLFDKNFVLKIHFGPEIMECIMTRGAAFDALVGQYAAQKIKNNELRRVCIDRYNYFRGQR